MRWLLALLALLLPPLVLLRTRGRPAQLVIFLWLAAIAVFFLVAWGVGVLLAGLAGLLAAILLLGK